MNYRHAFHAGNHADCLKHALLVSLVMALARKPAPFAVLDTHAGAGAYDLAGPEASRGGEAEGGIGRLRADPPPALARWLALVEAAGPLHPGSPALIAALLRPGDRLVCCELHPEEHRALRRRLGAIPGVEIHRRDGWEALRGLLPPRERRGLVLIDPPFERPGEFERLAAGLRTVRGRFAGGMFAAWYPIKHRAPLRAFHTALREGGLRDLLAAELWLREPLDPARLNGSGLLVGNPPWGFEAEAGAILAALHARLCGGEAGSGWAVSRLAEE
ncbi:MAG: 23S rRNA (adenine(2030)-N(6))-methyltransferase RlmJ [Acetobacteraceae bacterium]